MGLPRLAATIVSLAATTQAERGPDVERYRRHLDLPGLFRFVLGSVLTDDGVSVLAGSGGTAGRWLRVREPDRGTDLTDADATLLVGGKAWRTLPAATLTASRTLTLGTTNAAAGDPLTVTRLDVGAYTVAFVNGGAGAGTLITMPVSSRYFATFYFDGTNWRLRSAAAMAA